MQLRLTEIKCLADPSVANSIRQHLIKWEHVAFESPVNRIKFNANEFCMLDPRNSRNRAELPYVI